MADLNPLKFHVAIQDEATGQLNKIEQELQKLKDKTISVRVDGLTDLQNLLSALQHQQVQNIGKDVAAGLKEATSGLQQAAQDAVRESLRRLAEDLTLIKTSIQHDNFTSYSKRIEKCAESVNILNEAFKKFQVTIGSDEGLRNFMTGLGEVIRNVRTTMKQLNGFGQMNTSPASVHLRNVEKMEDALYRIQIARAKVSNAIKEATDLGMNVHGMKFYLQQLDAYEKKLQAIKNDKDMMYSSGWQTQTFGTLFKHLLSNAGDFQKYIDSYTRNLRPAVTTAENLGKLIDKLNAQKVDFRGMDMTALDGAIQRIRSIQQELQHFAKTGSSAYGSSANEIVRNMGLADANKSASNALQSLRKEVSETSREEHRLQNELRNSFELSSTKIAEVSIKIDKYRQALSNAAGTPIPTTELDAQKAKVEELKTLLEQIRRNGGQTDSGQSLKNVMREYGQYIKLADYAMSNLNKQVREHRKNSAKDPAIEAQKEYASLLKQISAMQRTEIKANGIGLDTNQLRQSIELLSQYRRMLQQIVESGGNYNGLNVFNMRTPSYLNARATGAELRSRADAAYQIEKANQAAAKAASSLTAEEQRLLQTMNEVSHAGSNQSQVLSDLKSMAMQYLSVWGAQQFVNSIIETGGLLEQQRLSIGAILGDMEHATTLFDQIKALAIKSPFGVVELDKMSKQLTAYGFEYKELYEWTKRLADISAATGTEVSRLSLALGHVRSEGALSGYTLRQFAMANVPVLRMLSENMGISAKEVRERVRKKEVSYDDVKDILEQLTNDGGMFYNAQETMSEALNAKFKNLRDAFDIMYGEIAEGGVGDALKSLATTLTEMAKHWERIGKDVLLASVSFGAMRAATILTNTALGQNTVATLSTIKATVAREQANLRLARASGVVTEAEYRQLTTNQTYTASSLKVAIVEKKLTIEELQRAVALGKVDKAVAAAAVSQAGYDAALINNVRVLGFWRRSWFLAGEGIRAAGTALKSLFATLWPLLAMTAVFEMFNRWQENKEATAETAKTAAKYNGKYQELIDLTNNLADANKLSDESLRDNISTMTSALRTAGEYTDELHKQVEAADTLAAKYELLKNAIGGVASKQEETRPVVENLINDGLGRGSWFVFGDNVRTDIQDYQKRYDAYMTEIAKNGKQIKQAILKWKQWNGLTSEGDDLKTGRELFLGLSSEQQQQFLNLSSSHSDAATRNALKDIVHARSKMLIALQEISDSSQMESAAIDFQQAFETAFNVDLSKATDAQKREFDKFLRNLFSSIENTSKEAQDKARETVLKLTFGVVIDYEVEDDKFSEFLEDFKRENPLGYYEWEKHSRNGAQTAEEQRKTAEKYKRTFSGLDASNVGNEGKKRLKEIDEERKRLLNEQKSDFYRSDAEERARVDSRLKQIAEEEKMLRQAQKDSNQYGDADKDKGGYKDKESEVWQQRIKLIQEARREYDYWEKKIGKDAAQAKVKEQFANLVGVDKVLKPGDLDDLEHYANALKLIRKEIDARYQSDKKLPNGKQKDTKIANDIKNLRELANALNSIEKGEFERSSTAFISELTKQIEDLTYRWDIFNSVRDATGNVSWSSQVAGLGTTESGMRTSADALKDELLRQLRLAGGELAAGISLDVHIDEESLRRKLVGAIPMADGIEQIETYRTKIEGLLKAYKEWQKLQLQVIKDDVTSFAKLIGSVVSYEAQLRKIDDELKKQKESNQSLVGKTDEQTGVMITQEMADLANDIAEVNAMTEKLKLSSGYVNLMNNSLGMTRREVYSAADAIKNNLNERLRVGVITAKEYAEEMKKLDDIVQKFDESSFFGKSTPFTSFMNGGLNGSQTKVNERISALRTKQNSEDGLTSEEAKELEHLTKLQSKLTSAVSVLNIFQTILQSVNGVLDGFQKSAKSLSEMFEALGNRSASDTWSDIADGIGAVSSVFTPVGDLVQNALSGNIGGLVSSAISSPIEMIVSPITAFAHLYDKKNQRHIEELERNVSALEANTSAIKMFRDRTLGYDTGQLRKYLASTYSGLDAASKAMKQFYEQNGGGSGYAQELANLRATRDAYMNMYNEEDDKKNSSEEALLQYKQKIAELDEQIRFFAEDIAKELWDIDVKSWADQLSDALCTAFENGESAAKAYQDTVKSILQSVMNKMMQMAILQPMFDNLEKKLFGYTDENGQKHDGVFNVKDPKSSAAAVTQTVTDFFGKGGEGEETITSALAFMNSFERGLNNAGLSVMNESVNTLSSGIRGTSEETSDLLAGYVNTLRQDVAIQRILMNQFVAQLWPEYYSAFVNHVRVVNHIDSNVQAMMEMMRDGRGAMYDEIHSLRSRIDNVVNGIETFAMR